MATQERVSGTSQERNLSERELRTNAAREARERFAAVTQKERPRVLDDAPFSCSTKSVRSRVETAKVVHDVGAPPGITDVKWMRSHRASRSIEQLIE